MLMMSRPMLISLLDQPMTCSSGTIITPIEK